MKNLILTLFTICMLNPFFAQIKTPQPSPTCTIQQTVGVTDVSITYSRPGAKGRTIFGDLVPYNKMWRTGANKNTIVSFSDPVMIMGKPLAAGKYALYTRPDARQWEIYFYKKYDINGIPKNWKEDQVALHISVPSNYFDPMVETFTISLSNFTNNGANLNLIWEHTLVAIPIEVPTQTKALESIEKTLSAIPKSGDYYQAAVYYLQENKDLLKAQKWMEKALDMRKKPAYWMYRQYALILAERNDKKAALKAVKKSLELAEEAGNKDYIIMNNVSIAEWSK